MKKFFILAGEVSGDTHGAGLVRALKALDADVEFLGFGGPQLRGVSGDKMLDWIDEAGVLGLWEVLKMYGWFRKKMSEALAQVAAEKPDAVILIDYPGFNLRFAKALRRAGYRGSIIYYISPQVWAWKKGRVSTMAKLLDLMICIFPFEKDLYEKSGLRTVFAGHPMVDRAKAQHRGWNREKNMVGFFPGSRVNEIKRLFPEMLKTAKLIKEARPGTRFAVSAANQKLANLMREMMEDAGMPEAVRWIEVGTSTDLMQRATVAAVASGTATLEAACFGLPYVLVYKVNALTYRVGKAVVKIEHLGIVNILAGETVVREMIQHEFKAKSLAQELLRLLQDDAAREALTKRLAEVVATLGEGGAYRRAAEAVWTQLTQPEPAAIGA